MRPWLSHYDADVPHSLAPYPERTLLDYLAEHAREHADDPGLVFEGKRISWAELERLSDAFAGALAELGVVAGDRVALILPNCPQFLIAEFAAWKVGAIVAPLNPVYTEQELATLLASSGAKVAVVLTRYYERLKAFQPQTAVTTVIATNIKEYLKPLTRLLFTAFKEKEEGSPSSSITTTCGGGRYASARKTTRQFFPAAAPPVFRRASSDRIATWSSPVFSCTSGCTARSRWAAMC